MPSNPAPPSAPSARPGLALASAVMFVSDLDRSVEFYVRLLDWKVSLRDESVALLVGAGGFELYLRAMGPRAQHPLGFVGIQYLMWTAASEDELARCEAVLRTESSHVTRTAGVGFTVVEGRGPDHVPILITHPGPGQAPRHEILRRIYAW